MTTKNPRLNISFDEKTLAILEAFSKQEHKSLAGMAKELILEALERREDLALSAIAKLRDVARAKKIKHEDAWK